MYWVLTVEDTLYLKCKYLVVVLLVLDRVVVVAAVVVVLVCEKEFM